MPSTAKILRVLLVAAALLAATLPQSGPRPAGAAPIRGRSFRMFVVGYRHSLASATTYDAYLESLERYFRMMRPSFARDRPNVVLLPEATSLTAWFIGIRGTQARIEGQTEASAVASLAATYAPQVAYYREKCEIPIARALVLALADTTWRGFGESLSLLARKYRVHVAATAFMPRIVRTTDPVKVELLGDPEVSTEYAYEAECADAYNTAFFFAPSGRMFADDGTMPVGSPGAQIEGRVDKAYLVPSERGRVESGQPALSLTSPSPATVRPVSLRFASFAMLTSKDAWMSDLVNRLDVERAEVFVQPEAGPWAVASGGDVADWPSDNITRAFWAMVQKGPSFRWGAEPPLIGNIHDSAYDGTPTIVRDAPDARVSRRGPPRRRHYLLGRMPEDGIVARGEWVAPDPGPGIAFEDVAARRGFLQAEGAKRLPGSGAPEEDDYVEDAFVWADVVLPRRTPVTSRLPGGIFGPSTAVAASDAAQWEPSLVAAPDTSVIAAWADLRAGDEDAMVARNAGGTWSAPVDAGPSVHDDADQSDNQYGATAATTADGRVHAVWVDFRNQSWDVRGASATPALEFTADVRVDHSPSSAEGYPNENLANDPVLVALPSGAVVAAWDDTRARDVDRDIRTAVLPAGASEWTGDGTPSGTDAADQFHPSLTADAAGRLWVAWQDHRTGDASVRVATSNDAAATFSPPRRVDDGPRGSDAFHPQIAAAGRHVALLWSDDRDGHYQVRAAIRRHRGFSDSIVVARGSGDQTYPAMVAAGRRRWVAAWTDYRHGDADVTVVPLRLVRGRLRAGRAVRADDSEDHHARVPALAVAGDLVWVAWEDLRTGVEQIRVSSAPLGDLFD